HLKDHLGNVRVAYGSDVDNYSINQVNSYYPFGLGIQKLEANTMTTLPKNEYLYNGKMFQDELGLNWLDYGARMYDAVVGRWWAEDPMSEVSRRWSTYSYCYNNPMRFTDPDGMLAKLKITGDAEEEATDQLQSGTENLKITRNSDGVISAEGEAKTDYELRLVEVIQDQTITVNIEASYSDKTKDGDNFTGGAFLGNKVTESTETVTVNNKPFEQVEQPGVSTVEAFQQVNPKELGKMDAYVDKPGAAMLHEVTEPYEGAKISQKTGISASKAESGKQSIADVADIKATEQPAAKNLFKQDIKGGYIMYLGTPIRKDVIIKTVVK
ncbi:MAG TPA: RHS repeat-associated core domain-containing protein, partial [Lentimicrobium sp.]|nr:RHS repeat-associated core domain-containing protein [Lentimicrobium sp.]